MSTPTPRSSNISPQSPSFSVALFDLDETLFDHRQAVHDGVTAHIAATGLAAGDADRARAHWTELEELHYARYLTGELDYVGQRRARSRGFLEPHGISFADDTEADAWFDAYLVEYQRAWALYDDTLACLEALTGIRLGIITNGERHFQEAKIMATKLGPHFEQIVASGDLGFAKPDPRIFDHACEVFGVEPARALYVGDRLRTDAIGAAAAGLTGVWLDRNGAATTDELSAARASGALVIRSLAELPAIVGIG